jgi:integrase
MPRPRSDGTPARGPRRVKLTELGVRKLRPEPATYMVWDLHQRGLALRMQPTGRASWKTVYHFHGRPRWLHLGDTSAIGLADARLMAAEALLAVAKGKDPAAEKQADRGRGTFAEMAERYLNEYAKRKNKSWRQADALIRRHVLVGWGSLQAASISRSDVRALMAKIEAPILANQTLAAISAIYSWAVKQEIVAVNPCTGIERNATRSRERILSDSELPLFWSALVDVPPMEAIQLKLTLLLGQRPGELAHMHASHIDGDWWTLPGEPDAKTNWPGTKNGQSHRVWLPTASRELVAELSGYPDSRGRPAEAMRAICAALGIERITPHDLRRTHGTLITSLGFGRDAVNRVQNHVEGGIASVYDRHQYADENKRVMEAVAARIMALAEGEPGGNVVPMLKR